MAHIDTLKVYEEYRASGLDEKTAKEYTELLEKAHSSLYKTHSSLYEEIKKWFKEAKEDFASQKSNNIIGGIIVTLLIAVIGLLWNNNLDLQTLKTCGIITKQETK